MMPGDVTTSVSREAVTTVSYGGQRRAPARCPPRPLCRRAALAGGPLLTAAWPPDPPHGRSPIVLPSRRLLHTVFATGRGAWVVKLKALTYALRVVDLALDLIHRPVTITGYRQSVGTFAACSPARCERSGEFSEGGNVRDERLRSSLYRVIRLARVALCRGHLMRVAPSFAGDSIYANLLRDTANVIAVSPPLVYPSALGGSPTIPRHDRATLDSAPRMNAPRIPL
jgi:hypothetical protein